MLFDFLNFNKDKYYWNKRGDELIDPGRKEPDYEEAMRCYIKAISLDPDFSFAWNGKGYVLYCLKKYEKALKCFDRALEIEDEPEFRENRKKVLLVTGNMEEAVKCHDRVKEAEEESEDWSTWNNRGNSFYHLGKYEEAIRCYDKVLSIDDGDNTCGWYGLIRTYTAKGDYGSALDAYSGLLSIIPYCKKSRKEKGDFLYHMGEYDEAIRCYDRVMELAPDVTIDIISLYRKGDSLCARGKYEEGIKCYDEGLKLSRGEKVYSPGRDGLILNRKGVALKRAGKTEEGRKCFQEAIESCHRALKEKLPGEKSFKMTYSLYDRGKALYEKGKALFELEKKDEAIKCYKELILYWDNMLKENPKLMNEAFFYEKAKIFHDLGEYEEAIKCYNSALKCDPSSMEIHSSKRECCDRCLESNPANSTLLLEKGIMLYKQGKFKDAVRAFDRALGLEPASFPLWYYRGLASFARGDSQGALESYDRAIEISSDKSSLWTARGAAFYMEEKNEEALRCFERSLELEPQNADVWYKKAVVLERLERKEESQKCVAKLLELEPLFTFPSDPVRYWYHDWCYRIA